MANGFSLTATAEPEVSSLQVKVLSALFGLLLVTGVVVGLVGFFVGHEHVYNVSREVPWGLMISTYAFFAITSTGLCLLAAISHVFGGNRLAPLANRMVWLSLITILSAFVVIGMEIASPWRMAIYNIISPNITSNIWWMGTLYGMALGFMLLEFWLILTRHYSLALALGILGALAEVAANTRRREALVVGNSSYRFDSPLPNPQNDAKLMASTHGELGFELRGHGREEVGVVCDEGPVEVGPAKDDRVASGLEPRRTAEALLERRPAPRRARHGRLPAR